MSIDFTLPLNVTPIRRASLQAVQFVPLTYIRKDRLRNFDLIDEAEEALPMLTREENAELAAAALAHVGRTLIRGPLEPEVLDDLVLLTHGPLEAATQRLASLFRHDGAARKTRWLLGREVAFRALAQRLSGAFLLIVPMRPGARRRRILKFSYDELLPARRAGVAERIAESMSWRATKLTVPTPGMQTAASYHLDASAPTELSVWRAQLLVGGSTLRDEDLGPRPRVHLMGNQQAGDAVATVYLTPPRGGIVRAALLTALLTSIVLTGGAFRLSQLHVAKDGVATLLVSVPALIAAYLARPGEHALASRLLFGVRSTVLTSGALSFVASAMLLAGPGGRALEAVWWSLSGISWLLTLFLFFSFVLPRRPQPGP